jgi:hypothetical protein
MTWTEAAAAHARGPWPLLVDIRCGVDRGRCGARLGEIVNSDRGPLYVASWRDGAPPVPPEELRAAKDARGRKLIQNQRLAFLFIGDQVTPRLPLRGKCQRHRWRPVDLDRLRADVSKALKNHTRITHLA